jgi:thiamine-phosphate pyrophosphorylase
MKLYAITDAGMFPTDEQSREDALVSLVAEWAAGGVEIIQIREKHLGSCALERLAQRVVGAVRAVRANTVVLINGRADVALAAADGVHLPGQGAITPSELRRLYRECGRTLPIVSVACHSIAEIERARDEGATLALFAPVFGKQIGGKQVGDKQVTDKRVADGTIFPGVGLGALRQACLAAGSMPVFALGGVTAQNAAACVEAGAAGIAAIRLFQSAEWKMLQGR